MPNDIPQRTYTNTHLIIIGILSFWAHSFLVFQVREREMSMRYRYCGFCILLVKNSIEMEYECAHFISKIISLSRSLKLSLPIFRPNLFDFLPSFIYIEFDFVFSNCILQYGYGRFIASAMRLTISCRQRCLNDCKTR